MHILEDTRSVSPPILNHLKCSCPSLAKLTNEEVRNPEIDGKLQSGNICMKCGKFYQYL